VPLVIRVTYNTIAPVKAMSSLLTLRKFKPSMISQCIRRTRISSLLSSSIPAPAPRLDPRLLLGARVISSRQAAPQQTSTGPAGHNELYAVADFCLTAVGTGQPSVSAYIAQCQRVLEKSGLVHKMHGFGTNIEGPWAKVSQAIYDCHAAVHKMGVPRITTDIRIGTRTDRGITGQVNLNEAKVRRVEEILARSGSG